MNDKVKDMFAQVTMPEATEQKIRHAMAEGKAPKKHVMLTLGRGFAAALAMFALVLAVSPTARAAVEKWVIEYVFPESGITIYKEQDASGNVTGVMVVDTEASAFAQVREGRLYYICNGVETDITDQVAEDTPFYYSYVDDYGLTHYRVVAYSGTIENYGVYEFIRKVEDGQQPWEGWEGGSGRNFLDPETEERYPWVDIVWEELNIPWSKPGD